MAWRNNLTAALMGDGPLLQTVLGLGGDIAGMSIRYVHSATGESIGAVLYVTKSGDLISLLAGPGTEKGRIGYVAVTQACDLLLLAQPTSTTDTVTVLEAKGFVE